MTHVPYGYKIEAGVAVQDEKAAEAIKKLFDMYSFLYISFIFLSIIIEKAKRLWYNKM